MTFERNEGNNMALNLINLDDSTRKFMLEEMEMDVANGSIYISPRLNEKGQEIYNGLLKDAIEKGDDVSLADSLRSENCFKASYEKRKPKGGYSTVKMPINAPEMLAEGESNRFYIRGLCRRAIDVGIQELIIYRAKRAENPRPESEAKIGTSVNAETLLADLRSNVGIETALGVPSGPNSGISVRLP